jgi:sec-independent protein translocase protein TatB
VFDVSFSELLVIVVVALLVIGPEKLPKVARTVGAFIGRMQRYMTQVKEEVNREMRFEELQNLQQEIKQTAEQESAALRGSINKTSSDVKTMLDTKPMSAMKKPATSKLLTEPEASKPKASRVKANLAKTTKPKARTLTK